MSSNRTILLVGALDSKGEEYAYLRQILLDLGADVIVMNTGVLGSTDLFPVDVEATQVAEAAGATLDRLRAANDRGEAIKLMSQGAAVVARQLYEEGRFGGVIGMGGSGGTSMVTAAMRALPVGVPKVCVSTVAATDTAPYVGAKDVTLVPSITDVAGVNRISRKIFSRAAGAVWGMVNVPVDDDPGDRPIIVASMFGNTTECVDRCRSALDEKGYEVLVFHATGTGGRTMESLIDEGLVAACLDITTTEWADEICGGVLGAGPDRLSAAGRGGIPHLIVPGCIDMANFGPINTVPKHLLESQRLFYEWNPAVTLMRTNADENRRIGKVIAEKTNAARGPVAILLPLDGVSILDGDGQRFCDREADQALFDAIRNNLRDESRLHEIAANINDPEFSDRAVELMLELISESRSNV